MVVFEDLFLNIDCGPLSIFQITYITWLGHIVNLDQK